MLIGLSDQAIDELELIRAESGDGMLRPERIVEYARDEQTALHRHFEWQDTEAAAAYRLYQARQVVRIVVRVIPKPGGGTTAVRAYVSLQSDRSKDGGYRATMEVLSHPDRTVELFRGLEKDILLLERKWSGFAELRPRLAEWIRSFREEFADLVNAKERTD